MTDRRGILRINVKFVGGFRYLIGKESEIVEINGSTVKDLIEKLRQMYGERFISEILDSRTNQLSANFVFLLNGQTVSSVNGLVAKVKDNDVVSFVSMVGGG